MPNHQEKLIALIEFTCDITIFFFHSLLDTVGNTVYFVDLLEVNDFPGWFGICCPFLAGGPFRAQKRGLNLTPFFGGVKPSGKLPWEDFFFLPHGNLSSRATFFKN